MAQAQGKGNNDQGEMKKEPLSFSAKSAMEKRNLSTGGAWSSQDTCLGWGTQQLFSLLLNLLAIVGKYLSH